MLVLEKTATTTLQKTPYLEYRNVMIENLGANDVKIITAFHDLRQKMIDEGAVEDTIKAYGTGIYEQLEPRKKRMLFGLLKKDVYEIGFVHFKTSSGTSNLRITAYNGHVSKIAGGGAIDEITNIKNIESIDLIDLIAEITTIKNIEKAVVHLKNVNRLINSGFETGDFTGWNLGEGLLISVNSDAKFTGNYGVEIDKSVPYKYFEQILDIPIECKYIKELSIMGSESVSGYYILNLIALYTDGTSDNHSFTSSATYPNWENFDLTPYLDSSKKLKVFRVKFDGGNVNPYLDDVVLLAREPIVVMGIKGLENKTYRGAGQISSGAVNAITIFDISGKQLSLDSLDVSFEHEDMVLVVEGYNENGTKENAFNIIYTASGSAGMVLVSPANIRTYDSDLFELLVDTAGHYKIHLKKKITFPNGAKVSFYHETGSSQFHAYQVIIGVEGE